MEQTIEGVVTPGRQLGRELGFPTANIALEGGVELPDGVYLSRVEWPAGRYDAISNLGSNPTVGGNLRRLECHLLDYAGEPLYGQRLRVRLLQRLRAEQHFESLARLRQQIEEDVLEARRYFRTEADRSEDTQAQG